jgi:hypothetical protein
MKRILSGVMCDARRRAGQRRFMSGDQPPHYDWVLMRSWLRLEGQPKTLTVESGVLQIANESDEVSAGASSVLALSCSAAAHRQFSGLAAALRQQQADAVCALTNWAPVRAAATGRGSCVCVCVCARARVCVCVCVRARVCVCVCVCIYVYMCIYMYIYMYVCMCICVYVYVYMYVCVCGVVYAVCVCGVRGQVADYQAGGAPQAPIWSTPRAICAPHFFGYGNTSGVLREGFS